MSGKFGWDCDLHAVLDQIALVATGGASLCVRNAGARLALGLPADREAAQVVVDLYQPQRWKGRVFRGLAKGLTCLGLAARFPSFPGISAEPLVDWLRPAAKAGSVGFLGCNPVHGWRCVLAGVDPTDDAPFVAKLGLGESAKSIRREAGVLESLRGKYTGIVEALSLDQGTSEDGVDRDWALLRLPYLGNENLPSVHESAVVDLLMAWLGDERMMLGEDPWAHALLGRISQGEAPDGWHEEISRLEIRRALIHGDFAVWNLRIKDGEVYALDWEWGVENGIGGIDLAHALRQEAVMVRGLRGKAAISWILNAVSDSMWAGYLKSSGWSGNHLDWLRMGLLHSHFHTKNESSELLAELGIQVPTYA
jgi:hypothetical protein